MKKLVSTAAFSAENRRRQCIRQKRRPSMLGGARDYDNHRRSLEGKHSDGSVWNLERMDWDGGWGFRCLVLSQPIRVEGRLAKSLKRQRRGVGTRGARQGSSVDLFHPSKSTVKAASACVPSMSIENHESLLVGCSVKFGKAQISRGTCPAEAH